MTALVGPQFRSLTVQASALADFALFLGVVSSCVVMFEPAPYDAILGLTALVAFLNGQRIPRAVAPLLVFLILFEAGGLMTLALPLTQMERTIWFAVTSLFLAFTCLFFACAIAERAERIEIILRAYKVAAIVAALLGIIGYLGHIEALTRYGRAKGAFKDPNVYGPFLTLPTLLIARDLITRPLRQVWLQLVPFFILVVASLFSFSRAAWFLTAFGVFGLWVIVFLNERDTRRRMRLTMLALGGIALMVVLLGILLSIPEIADLFAARAKLVQDYDGSRLGRLARHWIGFEWVSRMPIGQGPLEFAKTFGEDPHNVYLKVLLGYGWLGGLSYIILALWTLRRLAPMLFLDRPWQACAQTIFVTLLGHTIIGWIIDSDHWRHFFLLWGVAWGMIALESRHRRQKICETSSYQGS